MYNLSFNEAIDLLFTQNTFVRGENFEDGVYLMVDSLGVAQVASVNLFTSYKQCLLSKSLLGQKYRVVTDTSHDALCH